MNREERKNTIVGAVALALLAAIIIVIFSIRNDEAAGDRYIVIASFPKHHKLTAGDEVFMFGARVGAVQKVSDGYPPPSIAARMKVSKKAFKSMGDESVAWVEYSTPEQKARVIIRPGRPDGKWKIIKIRSVRAIEPPSEDSGQ